MSFCSQLSRERLRNQAQVAEALHLKDAGVQVLGVDEATTVDGVLDVRPLCGVRAVRPLRGMRAVRPLCGMRAVRPLCGVLDVDHCVAAAFYGLAKQSIEELTWRARDAGPYGMPHKLGPQQPGTTMNINGSSRITSQIGVLIETIVTLGAKVRRWSPQYKWSGDGRWSFTVSGTVAIGVDNTLLASCRQHICSQRHHDLRHSAAQEHAWLPRNRSPGP